MTEGIDNTPGGGMGKEMAEARTKFEATPAGRGLMAYNNLRSEEYWGPVDYARMLFMIPRGDSREASAVRDGLMRKVEGKDRNFQTDVLKWQAEIDGQYHRPEQQKDWETETARRAILMNNVLWDELGEEGRLKLSKAQIERFNNYMSAMSPGGEKAEEDRERLEKLLSGIKREGEKERPQIVATKGSKRGGPSGGRGKGEGKKGGGSGKPPTGGGAGNGEPPDDGNHPVREMAKGVKQLVKLGESQVDLLQKIDSRIADINIKLASINVQIDRFREEMKVIGESIIDPY